MIEVECECGRVIKTKDENAGKKARCPDCGEPVQIPIPRKSISNASAVKSAKKRPPSEDEYDGEDEEYDGDEEVAELPRSRSKQGAAKKTAKSKSKESADEPVVKKKKKKGKAEDTELNKKIIIGTCIFFGLAFLGLIGFGLSKLGSVAGGPKLEVPKEYAEFATTNGELRCQGPKGWESKTGGGSGGVPPFLTVQKDNVVIQFRSSPSGAAFQMMAQAGGRDEGELPDEEKPVSKIHELQKEKFVQEMSGYKEVDAPTMVKTAGGEGRMSAFTASEGFGSIYGYRVTLLGTNNQWIVTCKCSASQWKDFQAVFQKVISSTSGS